MITDLLRAATAPHVAIRMSVPQSSSQVVSPTQSVVVPIPTFDAVYAEHFPFVWRNLRRLGVAEQGLRDAAQDVFLVVHRRLPEFEGRGSTRSWLYSIARRVAADHRRRHRRKDSLDPTEADQVADPHEAGPEVRAQRGEALRLLLDLLAGLDEERRDVLILMDLEGMSASEAAAALGANVNTVYSRLRAARQFLQAGLARHRAAQGGDHG